MAEIKNYAMNYELVMIELTNCCNLDCEYCYRSRMRLNGKMLTLEELSLRLDRIKKESAILFCGMGEQLTHPQFYEFVELAKEHDVQLVTNGTILIDFNRLNKIGNVQSITFSVDGADEETILKSCSRYKYNILIDNLGRASKQDFIQTAINFVVSDDNLDSLIVMADFCEQYNVDALNILLPTTNLTWVKDNYLVIKEKLMILKEYIKKNKYNTIVNMPDSMFCMYNDYITPYISVEGYVRPCCSHDKGVEVVGKIHNDSMEDIMKKPKWQTFANEFDCNKCSMNQFHFVFD